MLQLLLYPLLFVEQGEVSPWLRHRASPRSKGGRIVWLIPTRCAWGNRQTMRVGLAPFRRLHVAARLPPLPTLFSTPTFFAHDTLSPINVRAIFVYAWVPATRRVGSSRPGAAVGLVPRPTRSRFAGIPPLTLLPAAAVRCSLRSIILVVPSQRSWLASSVNSHRLLRSAGKLWPGG